MSSPFNQHSCQKTFMLEVFMSINYGWESLELTYVNEEECPLCLTHDGDGCCGCSKGWIKTGCGHVFHIGCITNGILTNKSLKERCSVCQNAWKKVKKEEK